MLPRNRLNPVRVSLRISAVYIALGTLWILLSDRLLALWTSDKSTLTLIGMLKGWIFVFATGAILYGLIYAALRRIKEYQLRLHHNVYHDSLTGLPNRLALFEDVAGYFSGSRSKPTALLFLDLDKFKYVNDSLGHSYGDKLILEFSGRVAERLSGGLRVYRLSGDEFVLWIRPYVHDAQMERLAEELMECVRTPFQLNGVNVHTSVSIGGSSSPDNGNDVEQLLRCADIAMYQAKKAGGNKYVRFRPDMNNDYVNRLNIEKHLHSALENGEFQLHYQPQYDAESGNIVGFEALLRWNNPQLGPVAPDLFIPIAEDTRLIVPIGKWVMQTACTFISRLRETTGQSYRISVNLSVLQLIQDHFVDMVEEAVAKNGLPHEVLELEITETTFMESLESVRQKLGFLRGQGVRIALDDFGKGYSSLNCLIHLPITTLKIDKAFIDNICCNHKYLSITEHIVHIGRTLGLDVIAEGVETEDQMELLTARNCRIIQGYLLSKPLPEKEVAGLLREQTAEL